MDDVFDSPGCWVAAILIGIIFIGGIVFADRYFATFNQHDVTFKVNKTERVVTDSDSKYLIYTDQGVFQDTDSWWYGKFNSSDVYNQLEAGTTHTCTVVGIRNGLMSWYENIIRCQN